MSLHVSDDVVDVETGVRERQQNSESVDAIESDDTLHQPLLARESNEESTHSDSEGDESHHETDNSSSRFDICSPWTWKRLWLYTICTAIFIATIIVFTSKHWQTQHKTDLYSGSPKVWMKKFLQFPQTNYLRSVLFATSGTSDITRVNDIVASHMKKYIPVVDTFEYDVLLDRCLSRELLHIDEQGRTVHNFTLKEPSLSVDKSSQQTHREPFIAYSASGDVTGQLVYVNYGRKKDFERLIRANITLSRCVLIARYGYSFRGLKVMLAQQYGAKALVLYSDPADDGYKRGDVYPNGPYRPGYSIQGGSAQFISLYNGDPLTPGVSATVGLQHRKYTSHTAPTLPRIPVIAIGYDNARRLLEAMNGVNVSSWPQWQGGLDFNYHIGAQSKNNEHEIQDNFQVVQVRVNVHHERYISRISNIIGKFTGVSEPDQLVIIGNHRDAWVYGAADPHSGTTALLEIARSLGAMYQQGWRPRRTVLLASWDAEEYGLLGSVEYAEQFAEMLSSSALVYLNVDVGVSGNALFRARASPTLEFTLREASKLVSIPHTNQSVYESWKQHNGAKVMPLGSGSDFSPFLQNLGIAAADIGFSSANGSYGVYHSLYDSPRWMTKFGDPGFLYSRTLTKVWGAATLLLSDSSILPIRASSYGNDMQQYVQDITQLNTHLNINFTNLTRAAQHFADCSVRLDNAISNLPSQTLSTRSSLLGVCVSSIDRHFISDKPLPGHGVDVWYKHAVFAPGLYDGYNAAVLPGISEALLQNNSAVARTQTQVVSQLLYEAGESMCVCSSET